MATLLFAAAGSAIGGAIGGTVLGVSTAVIGQAVGAAIGRSIDQRLMGGLAPVRQEGPRLEHLDVMTSQEGSAIPDISGRTAVAGEVIWAARLKEVVNVEKERVGSGKQKQTVETTTYEYFASFAVSLGEGPLVHWGRIWADGRLVDLTELIREGRIRFYHGDEFQLPDPLINAIEGGAPAYRGTAYIVFEDFPLADYGNRIPQVKVEVWGRSGEMESLIRGVNIIPGSTEWGYLPTPVTKVGLTPSGQVSSEVPENAARHPGVSDWSISMDQHDAILPNSDTASLIVAWFGDDLRAGLCNIEPRVEIRQKDTALPWSAGGLSRSQAKVVSKTPDGKPSFGSSPADVSVIRAIRDLRARGKRVVLYPFIMMDITEAQALPAPDGVGTQGAYPWRGRIEPRAGQSATAEISAFMGSAVPGHFTAVGESVSYSGPNEWKFRRFILHLAHLAKLAGGVDAFLIGTEMRGVSMAPDGPGNYPFVQALKSLAAAVKSVLPASQVSYAADWSEYHSHQTDDGLFFHMDDLWSDPNIDFIGIDNYLPLSDWRPGTNHLDYDNETLTTTPYSLDYLKANIEGGEYWDWFYQDEADRAAQIRTPITDGAYGEPWVFRQKAIRDWQANAHHNRPGGVRAAGRTSWVPGSKQVWFTELGCPAVDLGANRPNVFVARNSSESFLPWFSSGIRDDFMQRQFIRASMEWWRDNGGSVLDPANIQIWCWDARPWPEFPRATSLWVDGRDWYLGHWLNGRAGAAPAAEATARRLTQRHDLTEADFDLTRAYGQADGYPATAPLGFRDYLQPMEIGLGLQAHEQNGKLVVEARASAITAPDTPEASMIDVEGAAPYVAIRQALEDVAGVAVLRFKDGVKDYETAASRAAIGAGRETGIAQAEVPLVLDFDRGSAAVERMLRAASDGRETLSFALPRSATHVRPGLILPIQIGEGTAPRPMIVERVVEGVDLRVEARSYSQGGYAPTGGVFRPAPSLGVRGSGVVLARFLDLPAIPGLSGDVADGRIAVHAEPWPGLAVTSRSATANGGFGNAIGLPARSVMGETIADLAPDRSHVWTGGPLMVTLYSGQVIGRPDQDVLSGRNMLAVNHGDAWEVIQFREAELINTATYRLTGLLRGQRGTDHLSEAPLATGAQLVVLGTAVTPLALTADEIGRPLWYRTGASDRDVAGHTLTQATFRATSNRPFRPAHLRGLVTGGDLDLSWMRRTREPITTWPTDGSEPPVAETTERYFVQIGPADAPVREVEVGSPIWTYTDAMRTADGIAAPFRVAVSQISEAFGPGPSAEITITE
ncbi:MAG: glycoside hydrolase/phage tail family protein [Pseudomonadota bacterium]